MRMPLGARVTIASFTLLMAGEHLTTDQAAWAMNEIMDGAATPAQVARLPLTASSGQEPSSR